MPTPPDSWLFVRRYPELSPKSGRPMSQAFGIFEDPNSAEALACFAEFFDPEYPLTTERDEPALQVSHYGFWCHSPAELRSRDIWFERHAAKLERYLVDPRTAQVFTYARGNLASPLSTYRPIGHGACPCPLPAGAPWPQCRFCQTNMVTVGVLDFHSFREFSFPGRSLVLHGCPACGFCANEETWSVHWLREDEPFTLHGDIESEVELGTPWLVTEYPRPPYDEFEENAMGDETDSYVNFSCPTTKIGGHPAWIQGDETRDTPFVYIGQMTGEDESLYRWDSAIVYLLYSPQTGETLASVQSY